LTKELYSANIFWILIPREVRIYDIVGTHLKTLHVLANITKPIMHSLRYSILLVFPIPYGPQRVWRF
jgi:hypothetical protein